MSSDPISVGVDPGAQSPAHACDGGNFFELSLEPFRFSRAERARGVVVYVEGQQARRSSSRAGLMTLSRFAGMAIGAYLVQGAAVYVLSCDVWRSALPELRGGGNLDKLVAQRRARKAGLLSPEVWAAGPDACDAELIRLAGERLRVAGALPKPETWIRKCTKKPRTPNPSASTTRTLPKVPRPSTFGRKRAGLRKRNSRL